MKLPEHLRCVTCKNKIDLKESLDQYENLEEQIRNDEIDIEGAVVLCRFCGSVMSIERPFGAFDHSPCYSKGDSQPAA